MNKRLFDIVISSIALVILIPIFVLIAILIKFNSAGPIIFQQQRVGRFGKLFTIYKFRTMYINNSGLNITTITDKRITRIGTILRAWKMDELPQLWNVCIGNMSLVGPRPEVPQYVKLYDPMVREMILSIKPGITDWASILMLYENQILANSNDPEITYIKVILPQKLSYAMKYVKKHNLAIDCCIIFATLKKILKL